MIFWASALGTWRPSSLSFQSNPRWCCHCHTQQKQQTKARSGRCCAFIARKPSTMCLAYGSGRWNSPQLSKLSNFSGPLLTFFVTTNPKVRISNGSCEFWIEAWMSKKQQSNCVWVVDGANQQRGGVLVSMICFCFFCNYLDFVLACKVRLLWRCILQNKENFWIVFWKVRIMFALLAFWCCFFRSRCLESTSYGRIPGHTRGKKNRGRSCLDERYYCIWGL